MWEKAARTRNVDLEWRILPSAKKKKNEPQTATQAQKLLSNTVRRRPKLR